MSLIRSTGTIGGLTLISRILGFARDMLMARFVGAGFAADAFLVAFRLPNLFRALFAEGAFSAAFVPMFNQALARNGGGDRGRAEARAFAEAVASVLGLFLIAFTGLMLAAAVPVVWAMTGGFSGDDAAKFDFTVELTRITFPYLMLISLASLFGGILNSLGRFWVAAAAPILLNLCLIVALIFFRGGDTLDTARAQAIAVSVSGALQLAWVAWACSQAGMPVRLRRPRLTPPVKRLMRLILPAALGAGAVQVNLLVSTLLAARFLPEGAISYLYYADRLTQLPLGLIGIGVGTALLPLLSRQLASGEAGVALHSQNRAIELVLLLTLPAAAALIVVAEPIVDGLLRYGAFTAHDSAATAAALSAFSLGLPAFVLIKVLTPGFHARSDTRTPVRVAILAMAVNLAANLILIWRFAHVGLALSTSLAAWINAAILYAILHRRGHFAIDARLRRVLPRAVMASALMGGLLWLVGPALQHIPVQGFVERGMVLALLVGAGAAIYFIAAFLLRAIDPVELRDQLLRRAG